MGDPDAPATDRAASRQAPADGASPGPTSRRTLVVDVANVVGSRPDGWWRDRVGATQRLLEQLAGADLGDVAVVAVVEGRARAVVDVAGVDVVRAAGSGDDEVVAQAGRLGAGCTVVTADRGLRARLPVTTEVMGPGSLLGRLPGPPRTW